MSIETHWSVNCIFIPHRCDSSTRCNPLWDAAGHYHWFLTFSEFCFGQLFRCPLWKLTFRLGFIDRLRVRVPLAGIPFVHSVNFIGFLVKMATSTPISLDDTSRLENRSAVNYHAAKGVQDRPQRFLPLRVWQEVQEMLRRKLIRRLGDRFDERATNLRRAGAACVKLWLLAGQTLLTLFT